MHKRSVYMAIHNCDFISIYCVTYSNFMLLLGLVCVGSANVVNKRTVKCAVKHIPLPYRLHLNSRDCIHFAIAHDLHKHT